MAKNEDSVGGDHQPEVYEIPGALNHYKYEYDVIVLDSRLEDYPAAREVIKTHEAAHADAQGTVEYLAHELKSDFRLHFSTTDSMQEVREYYSETEPPEQLGFVTTVGFGLVNVLRSLWNAAMSPLGSLYRWWRS